MARRRDPRGSSSRSVQPPPPPSARARARAPRHRQPIVRLGGRASSSMPSTSSSDLGESPGSTTPTRTPRPPRLPWRRGSESAVAERLHSARRGVRSALEAHAIDERVDESPCNRCVARPGGARTSPVERTSLPLRSLIAASIAVIRSSSPTGWISWRIDEARPGSRLFPLPAPRRHARLGCRAAASAAASQGGAAPEQARSQSPVSWLQRFRANHLFVGAE